MGQPSGAVYQWSVSPATGTSTNLAAITGDTATIIWDGPVGIYSLLVQVTDGNGCLSEQISQGLEILTPGELIFSAGYTNTIVCSDLAGGNEGSVPAHTQSSFLITYTGTVNLLSANITIKNPGGNYVDLNGVVLANQGMPEITVSNAEADKDIAFSVGDSWENNSAANALFEIVIVSGRTADNTEINANPVNDVTRNITVLPKPVIEFE